MLQFTTSAALAQTGEPLVTDRPDQTESAVTIEPGVVQIESGLAFTHAAEDGIRLRTLTLPSTLVRIGVLERVEARLGFAGWQRAEERAGGISASDDGFGDLDLGIKVRLVDEQRGQPQVAVIASTTLPTGERGFGSERLDPAFLVAATNTLSDRVSVGYNVGLRWTTSGTDDASLDTTAEGLYSVAFGFSLADRVGAFAEVFGSAGLEKDSPDPVSVDGGLTFLVRDNVQLDVSGGLGLNDAADDWFLAGGIAIRVPR